MVLNDGPCSAACQHVNTCLARYPVLAVGLPLVGGFLSALPAHRINHEYYNTLRRPDWSPPASIFAPTWTVLYLSIGYASHLVALRTGPNTVPAVRDTARYGLALYGINLALNFAWSPLFFLKREIGTALVTILGVTATAVGTSYNFFQVDKAAGYLTVPYCLWLGYATALNYDIWIKNGKGEAADKARKLDRDIHDAAKHVTGEAKDAARHATHKARKAANEAADKIDDELSK
ncbi:hypothetical protein DFQ27_008148 [Actinomortierella ambigua]|uniref:Uncharacterized protein n=1 Tax=Actinomortierella ambigua TaxID=1343610 RepID=A0A9P6PR71_9FUNG|nr:hypothetical protein DFQ26_008722 [Actinomortierella ambigua]KAG0252324.1 hypothetical protein DFQ27_008148 [Actinomortierella ambigua]